MPNFKRRYRSTKVGQYYLHLYAPLRNGGNSPFYTTLYAGDKNRARLMARAWRQKGYKVEIVKQRPGRRSYSTGSHQRFLAKRKRLESKRWY